MSYVVILIIMPSTSNLNNITEKIIRCWIEYLKVARKYIKYI